MSDLCSPLLPSHVFFLGRLALDALERLNGDLGGGDDDGACCSEDLASSKNTIESGETISGRKRVVEARVAVVVNDDLTGWKGGISAVHLGGNGEG